MLPSRKRLGIRVVQVAVFPGVELRRVERLLCHLSDSDRAPRTGSSITGSLRIFPSLLVAHRHSPLAISASLFRKYSGRRAGGSAPSDAYFSTPMSQHATADRPRSRTCAPSSASPSSSRMRPHPARRAGVPARRHDAARSAGVTSMYSP